MPRFPHPPRHIVIVTLALAAAIALPYTDDAVAHDDAARAFHAENQAAMDRMMAGMALPPSGDVDRDFTVAMIAHHQGAIDMAQALLRHGRNEQLRRIAQGIVVEQ